MKPSPMFQQSRAQPPAASAQAETRTATFTYLDHRARKVCVAGDFNNWSPDASPMLRTAGGVWVAEIRLARGRHEYLFVVDGKWVTDPKAVASSPNPHGSVNSVVIV
jgi:1,4-alpha-glucan branching enzyme